MNPKGRNSKFFYNKSALRIADFSIFNLRIGLFTYIKQFWYSSTVFLKAYGLAIWEWLFGMGTIFAKLLQEHSWICHITRGFATRDMTNSLVLLQKLCKNCPRPEKPFSNSKTISLYITYKNILFKDQNWLKTEFWKIDKLTEMKNLSNHRVVIQKNPLQITSDHFRMTTLSFDEFFNHLSIYHF